MAADEGEQQVRDDLIFNIFQAAMSRPDTERGNFLRQACTGNPPLLSEVERRIHWEARLAERRLLRVLELDPTSTARPIN